MATGRSSRTLRHPAAAALLALLAACGLPQHYVRWDNDLPRFSASAGDWRDVQVAMRDGARLRTRVLLPDGAERAPVVLIRNPYAILPTLLDLQCGVYVRYGIGCVVQDVRGRLGSEGDFWPLVHEQQDGEDTLAWLDAQPWAESIALSGISYLGATALAAAGRVPPKVKTVAVTVFGTNLRPVVAERGLFPHELLTAWAAYMPARQHERGATGRYRKALATRPHIDADVKAFGHRLDWYREWLEAGLPGAALWQREQTRAFETLPARIDLPLLVVEGFDDPFLPAALDTFERLRSRERSLLALLPVSHTGQQKGDVEVDGIDGLYMWKLVVPWLLHHLKGQPLPFETGGVKSWARGDAGARMRPAWPGRTTTAALRLSGGEAAREPCVQRTLKPVAPALGDEARSEPAATLSYRYDPASPWPSEGGARGIAFLITDGLRPGPVKQSWTCRDDVLRFTGAPLAAPQRIVGRARLTLDVRSSARDTAFVAKLVDVDEKGRAFHVTDGAATLRLPSPETAAYVPYEPGSTRTVVIDFFPTEWVLRPGHRLGLWISSSSFPMFSVHPNTENPWFLETAPQVAEQGVLVGGGTASALLLPLGD